MIAAGLNTRGGAVAMGLSVRRGTIVVGFTDDGRFFLALISDESYKVAALSAEVTARILTDDAEEHATTAHVIDGHFPMLLGVTPLGGSLNYDGDTVHTISTSTDEGSHEIASAPIEAAGLPMLLGVTAIGGETTEDDVLFFVTMEEEEE